MEKNLKGKECGKGIYQRKGGWFSAGYHAKDGKRKENYFETLPEAKNRLADARYEERHSLRHTYAARAIERGMQPKVLQQLLGHASIKTTMDRYVHVTDESLVNAIRQFERATPAIYEKRRKKGVAKI